MPTVKVNKMTFGTADVMTFTTDGSEPMKSANDTLQSGESVTVVDYFESQTDSPKKTGQVLEIFDDTTS